MPHLGILTFEIISTDLGLVMEADQSVVEKEGIRKMLPDIFTASH